MGFTVELLEEFGVHGRDLVYVKVNKKQQTCNVRRLTWI